jgi:hypothetical protein
VHEEHVTVSPSDVSVLHDKMVGLVETLPMTAEGFQPTAYGPGRMRCQKLVGAASREP